MMNQELREKKNFSQIRGIDWREETFNSSKVKRYDISINKKYEI